MTSVASTYFGQNAVGCVCVLVSFCCCTKVFEHYDIRFVDSVSHGTNEKTNCLIMLRTTERDRHSKVWQNWKLLSTTESKQFAKVNEEQKKSVTFEFQISLICQNVP